MAIVDAGEKLFHEERSIFLVEVSSANDLVEKFASLAELSDDIVALLVLEELVHFYYVWMIQLFEDVDLIEKHLLFLFIHGGLSQHLDGSLGVAVLVNADSDLSECSCS
jgi:hypothetical protein